MHREEPPPRYSKPPKRSPSPSKHRCCHASNSISAASHKLVSGGKDGCSAASANQAALLRRLPVLPPLCIPGGPCPPPPCRPMALAQLGDTRGCSVLPGAGGNWGWHHPVAPDGERVRSSRVLILGKWWGYSLLHGEQTATGVLMYKACPLKLTGLCKDLLHPALGRAIRAERDFTTYVGRKRGVRAAGEEPSVS